VVGALGGFTVGVWTGGPPPPPRHHPLSVASVQPD
jgi:hypothetical protein